MKRQQEPEAPSVVSPRLLYAMQRQIVATFGEAEWIELAYFAGVPDLVQDDDVLLPALRSGDDRYRVRVFEVLEALCRQRSPDEFSRYLRLAEWLEEHDPALGRELFLTGNGTPLDELEQAARSRDIPELTR